MSYDERWQYVEADNGVCYYMYVPENVNPDTEIHVYMHGGEVASRTNDWNDVSSMINEYGTDSIIVMPSMPSRYNYDWGASTMDVVDDIREQYNIQHNNLTVSGFSAGGRDTYSVTMENIERNPDIKPQVMFLLDDYGISVEKPTAATLRGKEDLLIENGTIIFSFESKYEDPRKTIATTNFAKQGLNIIRVKCPSIDYNSEHHSVRNCGFTNGITDYTSGKASLPTDGYIYEIYNRETDVWEEIDGSEIETIDKLYSYMGYSDIVNIDYADKIDKLRLLQDISINSFVGESYYVRNDSELLEQRLNNIISKIRNSTIVQEIPDFFSFIESTTKIPLEIPSIVQGFFGISASLMLSLNNDSQQFAKVGLSLEQIDHDMEQDTNNL